MIKKPPAAPTPQPAFFRSKWEEVDETELQAQGKQGASFYLTQTITNRGASARPPGIHEKSVDLTISVKNCAPWFHCPQIRCQMF